MSRAHDRAVRAFRDRHGLEPGFVARAPGRVNLIGEHTDYTDGFVLPMALPFDTVIAGRSRADDIVDVASEGFGEASFALDDVAASTVGWARYVLGMGALLRTAGHRVAGWAGSIATDIPAGASLSSSAALEIAAGLAFSAAAEPAGTDVVVDMTELALLGQRVENDVMGLPSGVMDQLASATAVAGHASLIDCRTLAVTPVALPDGVTVVVMDTGTRRQLVGSEYADRRATCDRVARTLGVVALRDADLADLERIADPVDRRRARHVISENRRTLAAVDALRRGDARSFGALMHESHISLRDDYEVSGPALDAIVEAAMSGPGCIGARMTGGGFAGGAVALIESEATNEFAAFVSRHYETPPEQPASSPSQLYVVEPARGASVATA